MASSRGTSWGIYEWEPRRFALFKRSLHLQRIDLRHSLLTKAIAKMIREAFRFSTEKTKNTIRKLTMPPKHRKLPDNSHKAVWDLSFVLLNTPLRLGIWTGKPNLPFMTTTNGPAMVNTSLILSHKEILKCRVQGRGAISFDLRFVKGNLCF